MRIRYFIDYRFDEATAIFLPIGVWMHNPANGDVDIYYPDPESPECEEANWVINRLVEGDLKTPTDFLEFHQQWAGYRGMRGPVRETDAELGYDEFGRQTLRAAINRELNVATN